MRGATRLELLALQVQPVSIHAPVRGATIDNVESPTFGNGFNPRTRAGCDHTPPLPLSLYFGFNPRTRAGCDGISWESRLTLKRFQSTHPCGVRPEKAQGLDTICCFNPRTRAGCDVYLLRILRSGNRFNPRTRAGCDHSKQFVKLRNTGFNPRTRAGCDRQLPMGQEKALCFNPRTRAGCDCACMKARKIRAFERAFR